MTLRELSILELWENPPTTEIHQFVDNENSLGEYNDDDIESHLQQIPVVHGGDGIHLNASERRKRRIFQRLFRQRMCPISSDATGFQEHEHVSQLSDGSFGLRRADTPRLNGTPTAMSPLHLPAPLDFSRARTDALGANTSPIALHDIDLQAQIKRKVTPTVALRSCEGTENNAGNQTSDSLLGAKPICNLLKTNSDEEAETDRDSHMYSHISDDEGTEV